MGGFSRWRGGRPTRVGLLRNADTLSAAMDTSGHLASDGAMDRQGTDGPTDLLARAEAAFRSAVADPATAGPQSEALVAEARRAGDVEAEVVALRAQAWCAVRAELAEQRARRLLNRAARLAESARLD